MFFTTKYYHLLVENVGCYCFFLYSVIYNLWDYSVTEGRQSQLSEDQNLLLLAGVTGGVCLTVHPCSSTSPGRSRLITLVCNWWFQRSNCFQPGSCLEHTVHFLEILIKEKSNFGILKGVYSQVWPKEEQRPMQRLTSAPCVFPLAVNCPFLCSPFGLGMPVLFFDLNKKFLTSFRINKIFINNFNGCLLFHYAHVLKQTLMDIYVAFDFLFFLTIVR